MWNSSDYMLSLKDKVQNGILLPESALMEGIMSIPNRACNFQTIHWYSESVSQRSHWNISECMYIMKMQD